MAVAAVCDKLFSLAESVVNVGCLIHCKDGRKLLVSKFLTDIHAFNLADDDLCSRRNGYACKCGDLSGRLTYDLCVERTVDDDSLSDLFGLLGIEEVTASVRKLSLNCVIYILMNDNRLLRSADHTVIKGL